MLTYYAVFGLTVEWVTIDNPDPENDNSPTGVRYQGYATGAARFSRETKTPLIKLGIVAATKRPLELDPHHDCAAKLLPTD